MSAPYIKPALDRPRGLWSLWDMLRVHAEWFISTRRYIDRLNKTLIGRPHEAQLEQHEKIGLNSGFGQIQTQCGSYGLPESSENARYIAVFAHTATVGKCLADIEKFDYALENELSKILFFSFSGDDAAFVKNISPFGQAVYDAFPSARISIVEAAKCVAFERYNAAVRHVLDAAEIGLRVLAWDRRVKPRLHGQEVPIDFAQWGDLVAKLETETQSIKKWKSKAAIADAEQFYTPAIKDLRSFNDGWRRHTAHARSRVYHRDETLGLMGQVRRLLEHLALRISERQRTRHVWPSPKKTSPGA
jgi:hypothetical protein